MTDLRSRHADPLNQTLASLVAGSPGASVVDVGGGSGTRAVPLARTGCRVTVVDPSPDALAILHLRAEQAGVEHLVTGIQADADALGTVIEPASADLVLCHRVLESVDDPVPAVAALAAALRPGGLASVLVPGRHAALIALAMAGRVAEALTLAADPQGRYGPGDPLARRFDVDELGRLLGDAGLTVESVTGIGVLTGLAPDPGSDPARLAELELLVGARPPTRDIASELHALARR